MRDRGGRGDAPSSGELDGLLDRHRRAGRSAQAAGRRVEETVEWSCQHLHQAGLAWVRKTEPAVGVMSRRGRVFFRGAGPPDFMGFLAGGRGVCFDLKTTQASAFSWRVRTGRDPREAFRHAKTKERQLADLESAGKIGALAGVLVVLGSSSPAPQALWVDWRSARALGEGVWKAEDILRLLQAVRADWPAGGHPDWLGAAIAAEVLARKGPGQL